MSNQNHSGTDSMMDMFRKQDNEATFCQQFTYYNCPEKEYKKVQEFFGKFLNTDTSCQAAGYS